jgi:hypothetical protein
LSLPFERVDQVNTLASILTRIGLTLVNVNIAKRSRIAGQTRALVRVFLVLQLVRHADAISTHVIQTLVLFFVAEATESTTRTLAHVRVLFGHASRSESAHAFHAIVD